MDEKKKQRILKDIAFLRGKLEIRMNKYRRNFNRYTTNGNRRDDLRDPYTAPLAYFYSTPDEDLGPIPTINLIRSAIETKVSKLSQTKVRPFFNPVNGLYQTRKTCRQAQQFFDEYFEQKQVYKIGVECVRDAEIFDTGWLWVRDETKTLERAFPWAVYFDPAEMQYGKVTRCFVDLPQYPVAYLVEKLKAAKDSRAASDALAAYADDPAAKIRVVYYYDLVDKVEYMVTAQDIPCERPIDYEIMPFVPIFCHSPIKGCQTVSTADNLYTIQSQIDMVCERISSAFELSPANTVFLPTTPEGGGLKQSEIDNRVGNAYEVPIAIAGGAITVSTPRPIDTMYTEYLKYLINLGYSMEGISELSAQSKKPAGANSGKALDTLEDVESERHNVSLQNYISFYMDVARTMIEVFPDDDDVLPAKLGRGKLIKFSDVKKHREDFSIQFSAASSLSKDPKTKMEQIEKMLSMGILKPDMAAQLMEMPDLENAFSILTSSYDACQRYIERAIEDGKFDIDPVVNLDQLFQETMQVFLRLDANDEKPEYIDRCREFLEVIKAQKDAIQQQTTPPPPPPQPVPPPMPGMNMPMTTPGMPIDAGIPQDMGMMPPMGQPMPGPGMPPIGV